MEYCHILLKFYTAAELIVGKNRYVSVLINAFIVIWIVSSMVITASAVIRKYYKNPDTFLSLRMQLIPRRTGNRWGC